ncbi:glycine-rich protein 5 [Drosophila teissieri]|uniref:glycine-rich protein 5 n=1 Tax=Drosophila teissieri TaxID=7243 RepID=UPI001CBA375E|nr:glycine-rich protein 5 [Drosophila teissieri]
MSNTFSYWNGQPVNAPVYPQMGDLSQHSAAGAAPGLGLGSGSGAGLGGWPGQGAAAPQSMLPFAGGAGGMPVGGGGPRGMPMPMPGGQQMGMGDSGCMGSHSAANFYGQGGSPFEPCIDNGEAFCAYNGMDMSMNYGGGSASKGGFW